jgi:hypothetical protein
MRTPLKGPLALCMEAWFSEAGSVVISVTSIIRLLLFQLLIWRGLWGLCCSGSLSVTLAVSERLLKQPGFVAFVPWPWKLMRVENAELHGRSNPHGLGHDLFRKGQPSRIQCGAGFSDHAPALN